MVMAFIYLFILNLSKKQVLQTLNILLCFVGMTDDADFPTVMSSDLISQALQPSRSRHHPTVCTCK